jgi:hypothetical protein
MEYKHKSAEMAKKIMSNPQKEESHAENQDVS